jgi:hypothetical protein
MRLLCGLAIAFGLSFPVAASRQQEAASSGNAAGRSPGQSAPAEYPPTDQAPAELTLAPEQKTVESVEKEKKARASASVTPKRRKHAPAPPGTPRKTVVREGGASEPAQQIVPGLIPAEAARQRQNAEQWLSSTDVQLKQLAERKLNPQQQETMGQIRNYTGGARGALKEGDVRRASTLAEKAHMLSDDLLHH